MDFSRPDNARRINKLKILNVLRNSEPLSRAEIARRLNLNKVSVSEIVDDLIKEEFIKEGERVKAIGRPATKLTINANKGRVFVVDIKKANITISASDLKGRILRIERFPRGEEDEKSSTSTIVKMAKGGTIYGVCIITNESEAMSLPFPTIVTSQAIAETKAEIANIDADLSDFIFLSWSEELGATLYHERIIDLASFAHMRVVEHGECDCGGIGCLKTVASGSAIKRAHGLRSIKEIIKESSYAIEAASALSSALIPLVCCTNAKGIMITGELSELPDSIFSQMQDELNKYLPPQKENTIIYRGVEADLGSKIGGALLALDKFFYSSELLTELEKLSHYDLPFDLKIK